MGLAYKVLIIAKLPQSLGIQAFGSSIHFMKYTHRAELCDPVTKKQFPNHTQACSKRTLDSNLKNKSPIYKNLVNTI